MTIRVSSLVTAHEISNILTEKYKDDIEVYGYFEKNYVKLSEQIQKSLEENDFMDGYTGDQPEKIIRYSKNKIGSTMLTKLDPQEVLRKCPHCFREGYYQLQGIV